MTATEHKFKTALITGGTSGIGLSIARELILLDFRVVIVGRNRERGKTIEKELNTKRPESAQFVELDLSNMKSIQKFADQFKKDHNRLDVLANIAGVMLPKRLETAEGIEMTFAVNYLSAFVLSSALLPLLEQTKGSRIVNVGGIPSTIIKPNLNFEDLQAQHKYSGLQQASFAVHAKTVLTQMLAERYANKGIDVISFNPGFIRSNLASNMPWVMQILMKMMSPLMAKTSVMGVYACSSPEIVGKTGVVVHKKKAIPLHFEKNYKEALWKKSEAIVQAILK